MKRVFVGLSGGVDSAVSAALLKREGYDVTGVFIKIWSPEFLECTWREDRLDAMRVAVHLDIPFREIDLSEQYKEKVVSDMIQQYEQGRTPNPDVLCNEYIKFGAFKEWAFKNGAEYIATGHYAQIEHSGDKHRLLKGVDASKDQSYFLYRLAASDLSQTIFPVGKYEKSKIREMASEFGLPNAERPDSQGLCFVGDVSMQEFLARFISLQKGTVVDERRLAVGEHYGAALYTIGQRHGFHLLPEASSGPYYVTGIDTITNTVHVSKKREISMHKKATLTDMHWIQEHVESASAVVRYHAVPVQTNIYDNTAVFDSPTQLTPGQSLVFYSGSVCLGGAIIHSVLD